VRQAEAQAAQAEAARDALYQQTELDVWQSITTCRLRRAASAHTEAQLKSAEQTRSDAGTLPAVSAAFWT